MSILQTEDDFIRFVNDNHIPLLFIYDEEKLPGPGNYPTFVCFEKDYELIKRDLPIVYILESVQNQIEYTSEKLKLEYKK